MPLTRTTAGAGPTLLVALGLDWRSGGGPVDPSPGPPGGAGAWRHGASARFSLPRCRAGSPRTRSGLVSRDRWNGGADGSVDDRGVAEGARVLVQVRPIGTAEAIVETRPRSRRLPGRSDRRFGDDVHDPADRGSSGHVRRPNGATASFDIRSLPSSEGSRLDRWLVDVAQLDWLGDIAGPVRVAALFDDSPPAVSVDSAVPQPDVATDCDASRVVRGGGEGSGRVRRTGDRRADGSFAIDTPLAPWPQTVEVTATDAYGNATTTTSRRWEGSTFESFRGSRSRLRASCSPLCSPRCEACDGEAGPGCGDVRRLKNNPSRRSRSCRPAAFDGGTDASDRDAVVAD